MEKRYGIMGRDKAVWEVLNGQAKWKRTWQYEEKKESLQ